MSKKLPVLPPMQCDTGCGECCGPVLVTEAEYRRVRAFVRERQVVGLKQAETCPFYQNGGCAVYEVRPFACRLFGHVEEMPCPRGYNVNVSSAAGKKAALSNGRPERLLHELLIEQNPLLTLEGLFSSGRSPA